MPSSTTQSPIIIYLPESGIEPYLRTHAILADAGRISGQHVYVTLCAGDFEYCSMMTMHNTPLEEVYKAKEALCPKCHKTCLEACKAYNFIPLPLKEFNISLEQSFLDTVCDPNAQLLQIMHEDFPTGGFSAYDFSLQTKNIYKENVSSQHRALMQADIKNTALSLKYATAIMETLRPSQLLIFNEYAALSAARYIAEKYSCRTIRIATAHHCGVLGNHLFCQNEQFAFSIIQHIASWHNYLHLPISKDRVIDAFNDCIFRAYGNYSHLFSINKEQDLNSVPQKLSMDIHKKICIVYTSSMDERYGVDTSLAMAGKHIERREAFDSQISWLKELKKYADAKNDVQFFVRVHPREGTRKKAGYAQHFYDLQEAFPHNSENFKMIWPDDPISSYDILEFADVVLVSWSTMGAEAARIGIPTLTYAENLYYCNSASVRVVPDAQEYFTTLDSLLASSPSFEQLREGIRFYTWRTFMTVLNTSETIDKDFHKESYWPKTSATLAPVIQDIFQGKTQNPIAYNIQQWQNSLSSSSETEENQAIFQGIKAFFEVIFSPLKPPKKPSLAFKVRRKLHNLFFNKDIKRKISLPQVENYEHIELECYIEPISHEQCLKRTQENKNLRIIIATGIHCTYYIHGKALSRTSKLVARLVTHVARNNI